MSCWQDGVKQDTTWCSGISADIMGVQSNINFISHSNFEDNKREHASRSHKNSHEASFLCQLYRYLRMQGYASSQITILSVLGITPDK
jgi:hypothetical protein